jgi:hypothetical protein
MYRVGQKRTYQKVQKFGVLSKVRRIPYTVYRLPYTLYLPKVPNLNLDIAFPHRRICHTESSTCNCSGPTLGIIVKLLLSIDRRESSADAMETVGVRPRLLY